MPLNHNSTRFSGEITLTRDDRATVRVEGRGDRLALHARSLRDLRACAHLYRSLRASFPSIDPERAPWWPPATVLLAGRAIAEISPSERPSLTARLARRFAGAPVTHARPLALLRALLAR